MTSSGSVGGKGLAILPDLLASPSRAFRRLAADPQWIGIALFVLLLFGLAAWIRMPVEFAYQIEATEAAFERFDVPPAEREEALANMPDPDEVSFGRAAAHIATGLGFVLVILLAGVLVLQLIARIAGIPAATFRTSSAVLFTASIASGAGVLVMAVLSRASNSIEVSLGPGAFFPYHSLPGIFLDLFDVSSVITLLLLVIGVREVFGTKSGTSWAIAGTYWLLSSMVVIGFRLVGAWVSGSL